MSRTWSKFFLSRIKRLLPQSKPAQPPEAVLPLGLSRDQLNQIQALTEMIPYKHYLVAVERLYESNLGALLRGLPHDAYLFQCGVCFALEQIAKLPNDLTIKARDLDARHPPSSPDTAGDPGAKDLERGRDPAEPLLSPAGDRIARIASQPGSSCQIVVSRPDGTAAHAIALAVCGAIAAWSPDGRQVLLLQEVGSANVAMQAIAVDSLTQVTIVSTVRTNGARSEPGRGDVSWQPVFP